MAKKKKSKKNANKAYKNKIYRLCAKVEKGDKNAEKLLQEQLAKSTTAAWAVEHWLKRKKNTTDPLSSSAKIKTKRSMTYGNAFKPYQGGLPGLSKNS